MQILHQLLSPPHHPSLRLALALLQEQLQASFLAVSKEVLSRSSLHPDCTLEEMEKPCRRTPRSCFLLRLKVILFPSGLEDWGTVGSLSFIHKVSLVAASSRIQEQLRVSPGHLGQHTSTPGQLCGLGLTNRAPYCPWNVCFFSGRYLPHQIRSCPAPGASPNASAKNLPVSP